MHDSGPDASPVNRLLVIGSVICDQVVQLPRLPERGGDVLAGALVAQPGGAFNIVAAACRLGLRTAVATRVGSGLIGDQLARAVLDVGAELLLPRAEGDSGSCIVFVEPDGERTMVTSPGAEQVLGLDDLRSLGWRAEDAVYVSGYDLLYPTTGPAVGLWLDEVTPVTLLLDPGPLVAQIPRPVLDRVLAATTLLSVSSRELDLLGGDVDALWPLLADEAVVLVRLGAAGTRVHRRGLPPARVASVPVQVIDSTGAGDAYAGALLAGLASGMGVLEAVRRANLAGAFAVTRRGSATGPTLAELAGFQPG